MTHQEQSTAFQQLVELIAEHGTDAMAQAMTSLFNLAMLTEREQALQASPYERSEDRRGHANGFKPKSVHTRLGALDVQVPQVRGLPEGESFYPSALTKGLRSERALTLALAEMYVQGVSTRKITKVLEEMCGLEISSTQVSRASAELDEQLEAWRNRPLGQTPFLILDARYEKIREGGTVVSATLLTAIGVLENGKRSILGCSVSLGEAEIHWREFLRSLKDRGLHGVQMIVSDDHEGLKAAREAVFGAIPWQRCQFHLMQNAMAYVPKQDMKQDVAADLRRVFQAETRQDADETLERLLGKYRETAPRLAEWMEVNVPEGLTVFNLPKGQRKRLRTINAVERLNKELKRRTRVATLFPNAASLLRLASAVMTEISDEWETGRRYISMEPG